MPWAQMHARNAKARLIQKGTIKRTAARRWTEFARYGRHAAAQSAKAPQTSNAPSTRALNLYAAAGVESNRAEIAHHEKKRSTVPVWAAPMCTPNLPRGDSLLPSEASEQAKLRSSICPLRPAQSRVPNWAGPPRSLYYRTWPGYF
jgi:hypothetical protein